jgi:hypothetical protein
MRGLIRLITIGILSWLLFYIGPLCAEPAPLLYPACLSDNAVMGGTQTCTVIAEEATYPNDTIWTPEPNSTCADQFAMLSKESPGLSTRALHTALIAYEHAREHGYDPQEVLTIVDYSKPSNVKRLWVFNLRHNQLMYNSYVAHGTQSGSLYATHFSDAYESHQSVLGVLLTGQPYQGSLGYSLKLYGLEPGFNRHVYERKIVVHPAWYVDPNFIGKYHEAGKSFGCLALSTNVTPAVINYIKDGSIIVNYFPSKDWLEHSQFLH